MLADIMSIRYLDNLFIFEGFHLFKTDNSQQRRSAVMLIFVGSVTNRGVLPPWIKLVSLESLIFMLFPIFEVEFEIRLSEGDGTLFNSGSDDIGMSYMAFSNPTCPVDDIVQ